MDDRKSAVPYYVFYVDTCAAYIPQPKGFISLITPTHPPSIDNVSGIYTVSPLTRPFYSTSLGKMKGRTQHREAKKCCLARL